MTAPRRVGRGTPTGGQFAPGFRGQAVTPTLLQQAPTDPRDRYLVVDGACIDCGHYDDHWWCENCSPSCVECGEERESVDVSLCTYCAEKRLDDDYYDDDDDDD